MNALYWPFMEIRLSSIVGWLQQKKSFDFKMSMRNFHEQICVSSNRAIETSLRDATNGDKQSYKAKVVLTIEVLELKHTAIGKIEG